MSDWLPRGNRYLVSQLIRAIENDTEPVASGQAAQFIMEMIQGVYASHFTEGRRVAIPQRQREHPLA